MLQLTVTIRPEGWDEEKEEFIESETRTLQLEHSLVSLSKWESKWHKPFLSKKEMTVEETLDYIKCMTLTKGVQPSVYSYIRNEHIIAVQNYIFDPMTATTFKEDGKDKRNREVITAEIIYYWMIRLGIPFECQKWHLNRLLTLIRVCNIKNQPEKKKSTGEIMRSNAALNAERRKMLNTKG